jgi:hypothetical protein
MVGDPIAVTLRFLPQMTLQVFFSSSLLSSLELSDTTFYEPLRRALLGTALHFCQEADWS